MKEAAGGLCAPKGFRAAGVAAGIKDPGAPKMDCALVASDRPAAVAGVFTTNQVKAPGVRWNQQVCARKTAQAVFINSGNANTCTGEQGAADVQTTAKRAAAGLGLPPEQVCVSSTGVIGVNLPMDRISAGVDGCLEALSQEGSTDAALAIMTTDTVPKEMALELLLSEGTVHIGAIAKGSGMIAPNMATMICLITTDASIEASALQGLLSSCAEVSFNRICVDNDMSTSDTVLCLANGAAELPALDPNSEDFVTFAGALEHVCAHMAKALVRDGEGASKFVEIQVDGAASNDDAKTVARSIAVSQLCKTAFFGEDPNWGRFACAAGYAGVSFDPEKLGIWIETLPIMLDGAAAEYEESDAAALMQRDEVTIRISLGDGPGEALFWTSDLSHDYVTINADYRT